MLLLIGWHRSLQRMRERTEQVDFRLVNDVHASSDGYIRARADVQDGEGSVFSILALLGMRRSESRHTG